VKTVLLCLVAATAACAAPTAPRRPCITVRADTSWLYPDLPPTGPGHAPVAIVRVDTIPCMKGAQ